MPNYMTAAVFSFLTWVDLQISALLADLVVEDEQRSEPAALLLPTLNPLSHPSCRASLSAAASICSLVGTVSVFISFVCWDPADLTLFRTFSVGLALASSASFWIGIALIR